MLTLKKAKQQRKLKDLPLNMRITGWLSPYFIYLLAKLHISPNLISFLWVIISWIGLYIISLGTYKETVIGILIFHLALFIDSLDGGLARLTGKTNAGGEFIDRFFSTINRSLILLVMGIGLWKVREDSLFLILGLWTSSLLALENLIKMKKYESLINSNRLDIIQEIYEKNKNKKRSLKFYIYEAFRPANHFTFSFFAIIFSFIDIYLYIFSVLIFFQFVFIFFNTFFELKNTKQDINKNKK